jgi:hypothetical protein
MPPMYYAYAFFPVYFWRDVVIRHDTLVKALKAGLRSDGGIFSILMLAIGMLLGLETLVSNNVIAIHLTHTNLLLTGF